MTPEDIHKLLGGYAAGALSADERKTLFEAALEDQKLFNALQDEDALRELLADPISRDQVRRALAEPVVEQRRPSFWSRRWVLGVAIPAVAAVILIAVMNRANRLIAPSSQIALSPAPDALVERAPSEVLLPKRAAPQAKPRAKQSPNAEALDQAAATTAAPAPPVAAPQLAIPALSAQRESNRTAMASLRAPGPPQIPVAVRQQFSAGFAANAPLYQGPLVEYSVVRSGPAGDDIRVQVTTRIAGYLALYQLDATGNSKRIFPANDVAAPVLPSLTIQIPDSPIKMADATAKLRLVVLPQAGVIGQPGSLGIAGGFANGAVNKDAAAPFPAPLTPLVVDIPLAPN